MKKILLLIFLASPSFVCAQKFTIRGQLTDTLSGVLPSATIMILMARDSSLVNFGISDSKGFFEIRNVNRGEYIFKVSFIGYATHTQRVSPTEGMIINLGQVKMRPQATMLNELVVKGERPPVTVKKDTIEFNAGSFKTKANANVEDLLKKMPGIDVETDGTVRAQGEQVQRVTVDGKEFFGRDPKLATRNLPADAVDKVQVFDRKSDQSQFTGIDDGQREKAINLELKEEKRNGAFGTFMAGGGTDDRFTARGNINRFSKGKQLSLLGMGNNINEQGFSISDYMNFTGGSQQMMGGGGRMAIQIGGDNSTGIPLNFGGRQNGILTNYAGGVNFNTTVNKKTDVNGSYFYNHLDQNIDRTVERINYLPGNSTYNFNQVSRQRNSNENHRLNFTIDHRIDSSNSLRFNSSASYSNTHLATVSSSETVNPDSTVRNTSLNNNRTNGTGGSLNSNLLYRHRFQKRGRSFSTNLVFNLGQNNSEGQLDAQNEFYTPSEKQSLLQTNTQSTDNQTLGTTLSYIEPLGGRKYLEASYNFRTNRNEVTRNVYDISTGQEVVNDVLSNEYISNYFYHRPGLSARMNRQKYNVSAGASWQRTELHGNLRLAMNDVDINRTFENVLPTFRFNYDFSNFRHLRFDYETSVQEPSIQQLQPVIDNVTNPINLSVGNPELGPAYNHRANLHFTTFDPAKSISLFVLVTAAYTNNAISYSQVINPNLTTLTKPVNVKNTRDLNSNINFGFPLRKILSRFNFGPTASILTNRVFLNEIENTINQKNLGGSVRYNFTYKEIFTLDLSANMTNQETKYESVLAQQGQNQRFFNQTYSAETNLTVLKNYQLNGGFDYMIYDSKTTGFNQTIPLLNLSFSRFLLKAQSGELKIGVVNLLNRNLSVSQQANVNYLEQTTYNNLGRYWMISFTYALNKQLNPMGGRRGPAGGMRMMMRN